MENIPQEKQIVYTQLDASRAPRSKICRLILSRDRPTLVASRPRSSCKSFPFHNYHELTSVKERLYPPTVIKPPAQCCRAQRGRTVAVCRANAQELSTSSDNLGTIKFKHMIGMALTLPTSIHGWIYEMDDYATFSGARRVPDPRKLQLPCMWSCPAARDYYYPMRLA
jgi:hypothetical protein